MLDALLFWIGGGHLERFYATMRKLHCQSCGAALKALAVACPFCGAQPLLGDRYEIRAVIGSGGMGEVFRAYDRRLATEVAIKRLTPQLSSNPELRDSLIKEARIMARLSDSAVVRLFDEADFSGGLYLIMEYVCGPSLRAMIRAGYRASPLELAHLMGAICQGLSAAHPCTGSRMAPKNGSARRMA